MMGKPDGCKCAEHFCCGGRCHAKTIFRWRGDFDFTNHRTLADFPGYREALDTSQPAPTSMAWRIRYDFGDLEWLNYIIDNRISHYTGGEITSDLPGNGKETFIPIPNVGPVRDGVMMGVGISDYKHFGIIPQHNAQLAGWYFRGRLHNYEEPPPAAFWFRRRDVPVQIPTAFAPGHATFYEDMPWALDIGCVRCGYSPQSITWPPTEAVSYVPSTFPIPTDWFMDDATRTLKRSRTLNRCQDSDDYEKLATYWPGDAGNSQKAPPCVPDVILWHHVWNRPPGSHNAPTQLPTTKTAEYYGWAQGTFHAIKHAAIGETDVVALLGDRRHLQTSEVFPALTSEDLDVLNDWLDLGGKTLLITIPSTTTTDLLPLGDPDGLLAALGSTLRIANGTAFATHYSALYDDGYRDNMVGTADPLAAGLPASYTRPRDMGFRFESVSGGTPLLNINRQLADETIVETWPVISYETLASGSRVVLYAMAGEYAFNQQTVLPVGVGTVAGFTSAIAASAVSS